MKNLKFEMDPRKLSKVKYETLGLLKNRAEYDALYQESIKDPITFWEKEASELVWIKKWDKMFEFDQKTGETKWFVGGKIDLTYNCLDRHLPYMKDIPALEWETELGDMAGSYSYQELHCKVCEMAASLRAFGVKKGDLVALMLPNIPQLVITVYALSRIGARWYGIPYNMSLAYCEALIQEMPETCLIITIPFSYSNGAFKNTKEIADCICSNYHNIKRILVFEREGGPVFQMKVGRDFWVSDLPPGDNSEPEGMEPFEMVSATFSSGSTGPSKTVLSLAQKFVQLYTFVKHLTIKKNPPAKYFHPGDITWDQPTYSFIYSWHFIGGTPCLYEGITGRNYWPFIKRHNIEYIYMPPPLLNQLKNDSAIIPPEFYPKQLCAVHIVGDSPSDDLLLWLKSTFPDTCIFQDYGTTELNAITVNFPGIYQENMKSIGLPFFGFELDILDSEMKTSNEGELVLKNPIMVPGISPIEYGNTEALKSKIVCNGKYISTEDLVRKGKDGKLYFLGRAKVDKASMIVLKKGPFLIYISKIEEAILSHPKVEQIKAFIHNRNLYCFILLKQEESASHIQSMKHEFNSILVDIFNDEALEPVTFYFIKEFPLNINGKIVKIILQKLIQGNFFPDTKMLRNPEVILEIVEVIKNTNVQTL